jgi:nucleoside-diphosphate-sugar epimerase
MIHAAARGDAYACFVRPDTRIPFMAMPDAVDALLALADARPERLTRTAYNVAAFSSTAEAIRARVVAAFPDSEMSWSTDEKRQAIIDSWPEDVDDTAARGDWGFSPRLTFEGTFAAYLIPTILERYAR